MSNENKYNKLKQKIGKWLLSKQLKNSNRSADFCSLQKAKKIGLTAVVFSKKELDSIKIFYKKIAALGVDVVAVCYIPEKKADDFYLSNKQFNFFHDKDLDFFYRIKKQEINDFQNTEFDILIDINCADKWLPINNLIKASKAKFKVGRFVENSPFDFMINIKDTDDNNFYYEQVMIYLEKFN
jgi:NDP-sugar pyrophosphorylase family protein